MLLGYAQDISHVKEEGEGGGGANISKFAAVDIREHCFSVLFERLPFEFEYCSICRGNCCIHLILHLILSY